jgi:Ferric reductase like transmembrane component
MWYLTRGTGLISLVLLTASFALGVSEVVRFASPGWPRFVLAALHRNVALLATAFVAVHVLTSIVDSYAPISVADVFVPFVGVYRPIWLGLGALAFDLLVALVITSLLRERLGYRAWRAVHWAAYACWPIALLHGLGTGSDTRYRWAVVVNVGCLALVLAAILFRVGWTRTVSVGSRVVAALGSAAIAVAVVGWMIVEPMRTGWARKAGTPSTLLASARSTRSGATTLAVPFSSVARGTLRETGGANGGGATVTIDAVLPGARDAQLLVVIAGSPLAGGGVRMDSGTVHLGVAGTPDLYQGVITRLDGTTIAATARTRGGSRITLTMKFTVDGTNAVGGTVSAAPGGSGGN